MQETTGKQTTKRKNEVPCFSLILPSTSVAEAGVGVAEMGEGNVAGIGDGAALCTGLEGSAVVTLPAGSATTTVRHEEGGGESPCKGW